MNTSVCSSFCTCVSMYIPRSGIAGPKTKCICGFDYFWIIPLWMRRVFPGLAICWRFMWEKKPGPHSKQISFFWQLRFFPPTLVLSDFTSPKSVNRGSCRALHKEKSLLFPQHAITVAPISRLLSTNMACLSDSFSRPQPVSPQTPNGLGNILPPTYPRTVTTVISMVPRLGVYPEPQLRVLTSAVSHLQPWARSLWNLLHQCFISSACGSPLIRVAAVF